EVAQIADGESAPISVALDAVEPLGEPDERVSLAPRREEGDDLFVGAYGGGADDHALSIADAAAWESEVYLGEVGTPVGRAHLDEHAALDARTPPHRAGPVRHAR